jgi:hypothetical protein
MELKVIIYVVGAILYFLYQNRNKNEKPTPTSKPVVKKKTFFEEILEEMKELKSEPKPSREILKPRPTLVTQSNSNKQQVTKGKDVFVKESITQNFEEGKDIYRTFDSIAYDEGESITEDSIEQQSKSAFDLVEEAPFDFDGRQAIIYSIILEKKF